MKKLLLALECSPHSRRAAEYAATVVPHVPGATVILYSVLSGVPYGEAELSSGGPVVPPEVHGYVDPSREVKQVRDFLQEVASLLQARGMTSEQLQVEIKPVQRGVANDIVDASVAYDCDTIVVGRRGLSRVGELLLGSTSREVIQKANGKAVWIVD